MLSVDEVVWKNYFFYFHSAEIIYLKNFIILWVVMQSGLYFTGTLFTLIKGRLLSTYGVHLFIKSHFRPAKHFSFIFMRIQRLTSFSSLFLIDLWVQTLTLHWSKGCDGLLNDSPILSLVVQYITLRGYIITSQK